MSVLDLLSSLKNKAVFNRTNSFMVDILFFDWLAIPTTNLLARFKWITPNMVTVFSGLLGIIAAYFFYLNEIIIGVVIIYLSFLLDCVDGNLARKTRRTSPIGAQLDNTADTIKKVACIFSLIFISNSNVYLLIGITLVHYFLQRVFNQKYRDQILQKTFYSRGLEPLFSSYDLLVILLLLGPFFDFKYAISFIVCIQLIAGVYSRFYKSVPNEN